MPLAANEREFKERAVLTCDGDEVRLLQDEHFYVAF
jgi:hypothetical protein